MIARAKDAGFSTYFITARSSADNRDKMSSSSIAFIV